MSGCPVIVFSRLSDNGRFLLHRYDASGVHVIGGREGDCIAPVFSPDGTQVLFSRQHGQGVGLELLTLGQECSRTLTRGPFCDFSPAWATDGRRIAFCRGPRMELASANDIELYAAELPQVEPRRLTENRRFDAYPCFAGPDRILFESGDKDDFFGVFSLSWHGGEETPLAYAPDEYGVGIPHVHGQVATAELCEIATPDVYDIIRLNLDAPHTMLRIALPGSRGGNPSPRFSHAGDAVACYAWRDGAGSLVLVDTATQRLREIQPQGMSLKLPRWSRDDRYLCCEETRSGGLALIEAASGDAQLVPDSQGYRTQRFGELYNFDIF